MSEEFNRMSDADADEDSFDAILQHCWGGKGRGKANGGPPGGAADKGKGKGQAPGGDADKGKGDKGDKGYLRWLAGSDQPRLSTCLE